MNEQPGLFPADSICAVPDIFSRMRVLETEGQIIKPLSPRELQIMRLMAGGWTYSQMTARFDCTERTIVTHVRRVRSKLNCQSSPAAIFILTIEGLITRESISAVITS